jgi:hypothetical protein
MAAIPACLPRSANNRLRLRARGALALVALWLAGAASATAFESGRAGFAVEVDGLVIPYRVFAVYVLPRETVSMRIVQRVRGVGDAYTLETPFGALAATNGIWTFVAPDEPGLIELRIAGPADAITLNMLVMRPRSGVVDGRLDGYRIGEYPSEPLRGNRLYLPPDGFIELDEALAELPVSPHFVLGQFPAKQSSDYPKFLVLREQLLLKLELLLERVNAGGVAADTLTVMSGYRTPFYNAAIGNVPYSRHVFGGGADVFVDVAPVDGIMDDLNGDGALDYRDAQTLYRIADRLFSEDRHHALRGGLGIYRRNAAHGPFVHIDARHEPARWGALP